MIQTNLFFIHLTIIFSSTDSKELASTPSKTMLALPHMGGNHKYQQERHAKPVCGTNPLYSIMQSIRGKAESKTREPIRNATQEGMQILSHLEKYGHSFINHSLYCNAQNCFYSLWYLL